MSDAKITINGQPYDSPAAMPPDVRRTYEEAMRSLAGARDGGSTQVFTGRAGPVGGNVIVNRTVTVNDRTYGSLDELPPDVRQQFEAAMKGGASTRPKTTLNLSFNLTGRQTLDDAGKGRAPAPLPIEPGDLESRIRDIPVTLAIFIAIALVLWFFLGR